MKSKYPLFITAFLIFAVSGSVQATNSAPPNWATEPPGDSLATMWGVGEGSDLDMAKTSALKDIAGKLRVAISAQIESRVTVTHNSVDKYARTRLSEEVQRTEFKNYKLEKSAFSGDVFYALVSVDRNEFIVDTEQRLIAAENEIKLLLDGSNAANPIEKFVAQQKALPWLEKAVLTSQVLSAADAKFEAGRLRKHEAALSKAKSSAGELSFELKAKKDSLDVANTLKTFLNESGMRIGSGGTSLVIETSETKDIIFGSHTVQVRLSLSVLDAKKRSLASKEFVFHGSSMTDHHMARLSAIKNLGEKLRSVGPLVALGFSQEE